MSNLKKSYYFIFGAVLALGFSLSLQSLLAAWVAPPSNPPEGNTALPINMGRDMQVKEGGLILNRANATANGLIVSGYAGIGVTNPSSADPNSRLQVNGIIRTIGNSGGIMFPDGSVQKTKAVSGGNIGCNWSGWNIAPPTCQSCVWYQSCLSYHPRTTSVYCSGGRVTSSYLTAASSCCSTCGFFNVGSFGF